MPSIARIETVGPTKSSVRHPRWIVCHVASGLEHETKGRAQYAFGGLAVAIDEGFASRLMAAGHDFPNMSGCEFLEIIEETDEERVDASIGRVA